jgi:hypothetical protein
MKTFWHLDDGDAAARTSPLVRDVDVLLYMAAGDFETYAIRSLELCEKAFEVP